MGNQGGTGPFFGDRTNFRGQDRDIRLIKNQRETETEKEWTLNFYETRLSHKFLSETRPRQDLTRNVGRHQDETKSLGVFLAA